MDNEYKIIDDFQVGEYRVLQLDRSFNSFYAKSVIIDGQTYEYTINSVKSWVVIKSSDVFNGKIAVFVLDPTDHMNDKKKCACCGKETLDADSTYDICPVCGWENDELQEDDPDLHGGANKMSLNEAKRAYKEGRKVK